MNTPMRAALGLAGLATLASVGFVVGSQFAPNTPSTEAASGSNDPIRSQLSLREDDNGKLYIGGIPIDAAYNVDRVLREAPAVFFDALPTTCVEALDVMSQVVAAQPSFADASQQGRGIWGQTTLAAQSLCSFGEYDDFFDADVTAWLNTPSEQILETPDATAPADVADTATTEPATTEPATTEPDAVITGPAPDGDTADLPAVDANPNPGSNEPVPPPTTGTSTTETSLTEQ
mgnify:CR=1 FL=1